MKPCGDKARYVGNVHQDERPDRIGYLPELLKIYLSWISACSSDYHFWSVFTCKVPYHIVIYGLVILFYSVWIDFI